MKHWSRWFLPSLAVVCLVSSVVLAEDEATTHEPTLAQRLAITRANQRVAQTDDRRKLDVTVSRPFAEYEKGRYLLISAASGYQSQGITSAIAQHLPVGIQLFVLAGSETERASAYATYHPYLDDTRLTVVNLGSKSGLWSRDSLPIPVWTQDDNVALVDARYYHSNEPDEALAELFRAPLLQHRYFFEGGNLMNDDEGNCFVIAKPQTNDISDEVFRRYYGCRELTRLPHVAGIGHVDERLKFLPDKNVVTDESSYIGILKPKGYSVSELPRPNSSMGTYANALFLNNTVFMPTYDEPGDAVAAGIYRNLGYEVVPVDSARLSSEGKGSIHCITMVYPNIPKTDLLQWLKQ